MSGARHALSVRRESGSEALKNKQRVAECRNADFGACDDPGDKLFEREPLRVQHWRPSRAIIAIRVWILYSLLLLLLLGERLERRRGRRGENFLLRDFDHISHSLDELYDESRFKRSREIPDQGGIVLCELHQRVGMAAANGRSVVATKLCSGEIGRVQRMRGHYSNLDNKDNRTGEERVCRRCVAQEKRGGNKTNGTWTLKWRGPRCDNDKPPNISRVNQNISRCTLRLYVSVIMSMRGVIPSSSSSALNTSGIFADSRTA